MEDKTDITQVAKEVKNCERKLIEALEETEKALCGYGASMHFYCDVRESIEYPKSKRDAVEQLGRAIDDFFICDFLDKEDVKTKMSRQMKEIDEEIVSEVRQRTLSAENFLRDVELELEGIINLLKTNLVSGKIPKEMMAFYPIAERLSEAIDSFRRFSYLVSGEGEEEE